MDVADSHEGPAEHLRRYRDTQVPVLIAFCKERLAAYKCPRSVEVMDDLPKTVTGKILRRELRKVKERRLTPIAEQGFIRLDQEG